MTKSFLSIATCPKAFTGPAALTQRNTLDNWRALGPEVEILLLGDDFGTAEAAAEFGAQHIPIVARNEKGTPLVSDLFAKSRQAATAPFLCYCNADILLPPTFLAALRLVAGRWPDFLMAGRRWDVAVPEALDFSGDWAERLASLRQNQGRLAGPQGIDYFLFPKASFSAPPNFAIGRYFWDNWIVQRSVADGRPLVDATDFVPIVHQSHGYPHLLPAITTDPEYLANQALFTADFPKANIIRGTLAAAKWQINATGQILPKYAYAPDQIYWRLYFWRAGCRKSLKIWIGRIFGQKILGEIIRWKHSLWF